MAMPPGSVIPSEKMQFPAAAAATATAATGAGHWIPDERDGFIMWLRSEFAAANAIIDSLCQHFRAIGDPGEYDAVIATIQQRRTSWTPILHMQQYFPVVDVVYTLQQIAWKRQQQPQALPPQRHFISDQGKFGGREFRRSGPGFNKLQGGQRGAVMMVKDAQNSNLDGHSVDRFEKREEAKLGGGGNNDDNALSVTEEKRGTDGSENSEATSEIPKASGNSEKSEITSLETQAGLVNHKCNSNSKDNSVSSEQTLNEKEKESPTSTGKTFVVTEMYEGKTVNVVEGLKLYDELFDAKEVLELVSLVNDMRVSGKRGQLQGQAFVAYKRPMRGRGREMIQLGLPIADSPVDDEAPAGSSKDRKVEPIPRLLHDVIERLVATQITPMKPDACIIDFYNEGDHSQPHMSLPWFGRPVCLMLLSECDLTFGRVIVSDHPGDYKGSLKLSLTPGSVLVMQGKSADLAKYAIHSTRKQRILITFTKSQPKKSMTGPNWGPPPSRSPNHHFRHSSGPPKHYPSIPSTGVLPTPSHRPPNGVVQPLFIAPAPPMPFPSASVAAMPPPGSSGWPVPPPPRHQPQPWMPLPGTGVFLPPGSGSNHSTAQESDLNDSLENPNNNNNNAEGKLEKKAKEACNGSVDGTGEDSDGKQSSQGRRTEERSV